MSTSNLLNAQFDDSEDEDDNFNPQPADLSDDGGDDDAGAQIRKEASRTREVDGSDDEAPAPRRQSVDDENGEDEDDEDAEGEGEDITQGALDDDDEDEEEDEEEEITVGTICPS